MVCVIAYLLYYRHTVDSSTLTELIDEVYQYLKDNYVTGESVECNVKDTWVEGKIVQILNDEAKENGKLCSIFH